ncbi:putative type II DNA modification enzyme domain protein [Mycobacterium kansasii 824]|nr:putative type II DNA modification enzyme domain protein [Mycobacterium kansasii 824]
MFDDVGRGRAQRRWGRFGVPVRTVASAAAIRRAAATTKCPLPQAGSTTDRSSSAASGSAERSASSISGFSASSSTNAISSEGV